MWAARRGYARRPADLRERAGAALVVVLSNGAAVTTGPRHDRVGSIVEAWLPGRAGAGGVVALEPGESTRVTFGLENPDFACWDVAAGRGDGRLGA